MSPQEKRNSRFDGWLSPPGVKFLNSEAEATYKATVNRFRDVVDLKVPDRVPVLQLGTFIQPSIYGVTPHEVMYDAEKLKAVNIRFLQDYRPDIYMNPALVGNGKVLEILDYKQYKWPGHGVSEEAVYQYVEGEYMQPAEYQALIDDPTDFWLRTYLPRAFGALAPFKSLPPFTELWEMVLVSGHMVAFGTTEMQDALKAIMDAGKEAIAWIQHIVDFDLSAKSMGFVGGAGGVSKAPFDILGDTLRGTKAMMLDMYKRPEMILKAIERITPLAIRQGVRGATARGNPVVFMPLHKGADGFMSETQFKKFYWPSLKEVILGLAAEGCIPFLFCEGGYNSRLQYLGELPKGSCLCIFDRTDMELAKKALGNTLCIGGNVPSGLILTGTAAQVRDYCRELIDVAGKGGGYIMSLGCSMDEARPETLHAMIDFTREYGVYG
jgi:hypothetical protein